MAIGTGKDGLFCINGEFLTSLEHTDVIGKESSWTLYMRRNNTHYFNSPFGKRIIEIDPCPQELKDIKYGEEIAVTWEYASR